MERRSGKVMTTITASELKSLIGKVNIIDVREPGEYSSGHIPTAKNIPMTGLITNHEHFLNKDDKYYIICLSGARGAQMCNYLEQHGYDVVNVVGGTSVWEGNLEY